MRVVLDTNILVSALISPSGYPAAIYDAWEDGKFTLLTCAEHLEEVGATLRKPRVARLIKPHHAGRLVNQIRELAEEIGPLPRVRRSPDARMISCWRWLRQGARTVLSLATRAACYRLAGMGRRGFFLQGTSRCCLSEARSQSAAARYFRAAYVPKDDAGRGPEGPLFHEALAVARCRPVIAKRVPSAARAECLDCRDPSTAVLLRLCRSKILAQDDIFRGTDLSQLCRKNSCQ